MRWMGGGEGRGVAAELADATGHDLMPSWPSDDGEYVVRRYTRRSPPSVADSIRRRRSSRATAAKNVPWPTRPSSARTSSRSRARPRGSSRRATTIHIAVSPNRPNRPLTSFGLDDRARRPAAAVAVRGVRQLVVLVGVDDHRAADGADRGVEEGRRAGRDRDAIGGRVEVPDAVRVDDEVRQVAGMGAIGIHEAVLRPERVVVRTGGREGWAAGADGMDVDAVE